MISKKIFMAALSVALILSLAGCTRNEHSSNSAANSNSNNSTYNSSTVNSSDNLTNFSKNSTDNSTKDDIDNNSSTNNYSTSENESVWIVATASDFEYEYNDDAIEITKYIGLGGNVIIPDIIDGKPVTIIAEEAFYNNRDLTGIEIPDSVKYVYDSAFENCSNLKSAVLGNGMTKISKNTFYKCALENIEFGDNITYIGAYAFAECPFTNIEFPDVLTEIAESAFFFCQNLLSIEIPEGVTIIGKNAFYWCYALEKVTLPDTITEMKYCFDYNNLINGITYRGKQYSVEELENEINNNTVYDENGLYIEDDILIDALDYMEGEIAIPDGVKEIKYSAFKNCRLSGVSFPDSLTKINAWAFESCLSLTSVTIPDSVTFLGSENGKTGNSDVFRNCPNIKSVVIGTGLTAFSDFYFCANLTSVTLPDNLTLIGGFVGCTSLTSITLPDSLTEICDSAFNGCNRLTDVIIPDSVTRIGSYAFMNCTRLSATYKGKTYDVDHLDDLYKAINRN